MVLVKIAVAPHWNLKMVTTYRTGRELECVLADTVTLPLLQTSPQQAHKGPVVWNIECAP
jgi:hypothetical protein